MANKDKNRDQVQGRDRTAPRKEGQSVPENAARREAMRSPMAAGGVQRSAANAPVAMGARPPQAAPAPAMRQVHDGMTEMPQAAQAAASGAVDGLSVLKRTIDKEKVREARNILMEYKQGKANLEQRVIEDEQWYKLRSWECMRKTNKAADQVEPVSGWLFNAIANKHADSMDNIPEPIILPREEGDKQEAERLSSVLPVILEQNGFEDVFDSEVDDKIRQGTGVFGVFWDESKLHGMGDIAVEHVDILSLFWQPGITDIQRSPNFFHVTLMDNEQLVAAYPQLNGKLSSSTIDLSRYVYDDSVDTQKKSAVIDWYYKKRQGKRTILHLCKFVNDEVLFATENEAEKYPGGWYDHGLYPYVFDPLYRVKGTPCGFGYIDIGKSAQEYIDRGNQAILQNMLANTRPRHFIRSDGSVNEEEYADMTKDFVHVDGNLGQDSILPIQGKPLSNVYVEVINNKIDELKEVTGNRDISTGGTSSGVTAASAIAAMQEAGSKLSRDDIKASFRAFRKVVYMMVELIRQFYDTPRFFRILGENGQQEFVAYSNANIKPVHQGVEMGIDLGMRSPLFDIEITAQKKNPYSKMSQNELALQFYAAGLFNPQMSDQALVCLDMMDFDRKEFIMQKIAQNGGMYQQMLMMQQQMLMLAQMVDQTRGSNLADQIAAGVMGTAAPLPVDGEANVKTDGNAALGGDETKGGESSVTQNARKRVAESTSPT